MTDILKHRHIRLGEILIAEKLITEDDLQAALKEQERSGGGLAEVLLRIKFQQKPQVLYRVLAKQLRVDFVDCASIEIPPVVVSTIPAQTALYFKVLPIEFKDDELVIATSDPTNVDKLDGLTSIVGKRIRFALAIEADILDGIRQYYGLGAETIARMLEGKETVVAASEPAIEDISDVNSEASIARFVNQVLLEACRNRATDIHFEPYENDLRVRYRIDGVLHDAPVPAEIRHFKDAINSRIKILSRLNIAEKRLPQDGRFNVLAGKQTLDLRISFLPTAWGESLVLRILEHDRLRDLSELGFAPHDLVILEKLLQVPHGLIFVTGPTGSGKTTTLYSCLSRLNRPEHKIITIEDPVEVQLKGIAQIQVNPTIGLTFSHGLRSILRHDPDIMMVGEVRDRETAEIAVQVALTGHLVFSSIHTNDASSGAARLIDIGCEPYLISSSVICFIAQRLVRVLCPSCKKSTSLDEELVTAFGIKPADIQSKQFFASTGCELCQMTGFRGRIAIYEFLLVTNDIRQLIQARASAQDIRRQALKQGMIPLRQTGWQKVCLGLTTPEEVLRVTRDEAM
jgi:general secretion pathway protein E